MAYRLLDLFCGRWGWSKAFAARGWECVGVDLVEPPDIPEGCKFIRRDVMEMTHHDLSGFDFVCASSPCEEFSVHGMKLFHPKPKYPEEGIRLFNGTRYLCESAGIPYIMENVRSAQQFVGKAVHHCGPFYLWGNGVPPLMNQGIKKGALFGKLSRAERKEQKEPYYASGSNSKARREIKAQMATIPPELANSVADYAERILEQKEQACQTTKTLSSAR